MGWVRASELDRSEIVEPFRTYWIRLGRGIMNDELASDFLLKEISISASVVPHNIFDPGPHLSLSLSLNLCCNSEKSCAI